MKWIVKTGAAAAVLSLALAQPAVVAAATTSSHARPVSTLVADDSWTWTDLGGQVVGWAAAGAAAGAFACGAAGAGAGAVTGAASGAAYYVGTQAWEAAIGDVPELHNRLPRTALD